MLYAAWLNTKGKYERYNCYAKDKKDKLGKPKKGGSGSVVPVSITDRLASCVSIHAISKKGLIMLHIPPLVGQYIRGERFPDSWAEVTRQGELMIKAVQKLVDDHWNDMGGSAGVTIAAVQGFDLNPYRAPGDMPGDNQAQERAVAKALEANTETVRRLFSLPISAYHTQTHDPHGSNADVARTTTVQMFENPPLLWSENDAIPITIPT
jgi:hypothetical protein